MRIFVGRILLTFIQVIVFCIRYFRKIKLFWSVCVIQGGSFQLSEIRIFFYFILQNIVSTIDLENLLTSYETCVPQK